MSWKAEVKADDSSTWYFNALRFATKEEATGYGADLSFRWTSVRDMRVAESEDPATHHWTGTHTERLS